MKKGSLLLLLTAFIWGMAFVAQSVAMDSIGPWTFTSARSFIGGITLLFVIPFLNKNKDPNIKEDKALLWKGGLTCGIALCAATIFQQIGIVYTTVGKAGFITALYVVIVPILSLFLGKRPTKKIWIAVILSVIGLYFLCMNESLILTSGDTMVMICAFLFAIHILVVGHFSPYTDGVKLSCIQFFVAGFISLPFAIILEHPQFTSIIEAIVPILYAGVLSSGVGYTLQIVGQKDVPATMASLIMSLESVFAVIGGIVILHEMMSLRELLGCALTFGAVILAEIPDKKSPETIK